MHSFALKKRIRQIETFYSFQSMDKRSFLSELAKMFGGGKFA